MIHQRTIGIGIAAFVVCFALATTTMAQCDCGSCGSDSGVGGEIYDSSVSSFLQNVGTGQGEAVTGCVNNCCERPRCPAVRCGPYVSVFGGWSCVSEFFRLEDLGTITTTTRTQVLDQNGNPALDSNGNQIFDTETTTTVNVEERQFNFDDAFTGGIAIGRQVHQRGRFELELTYRNPDVNSFQVQVIADDFLDSDTISAATGSLESYSLMGNFLFDFSYRAFKRYNFYGGAGLGVMNFSGDATTATNVYEIDDTTFVFQAIGGLNRTITSRVDIFGEYRYVVADDVSVFDVTAGSALGDFSYKSNDVFVGLRLRR